MDLSSDIGLLRREVRDVRAVASNIDHRTKLDRLVQPSAYHRRGQPGRVLCACTLKNCEAVSPPSGQPGAANSAILRWPRSGRCSSA